MLKVLCLLFLTSSLLADNNYHSSSRFDVSIDHSSSSFEMRKKMRVDVFDFSGAFPQLENIDIDARRKKRVEFYMTGDYPKLKKVNYEGSFGNLSGELTGHFPLLSQINFLCGSCTMDLDLTAPWEHSCEITITGMREDIHLKLPKDVGLIISTKTGVKGKVFPSEELKKKGWLGVWNKTFRNALADQHPIVLTLYIETTDGKIFLE